METDRWLQIEELYLAALDISEDQRSLFLEKSCDRDDDLRREIESLLTYETCPGDILESSPPLVAAEMLAECRGEPDELSELQPVMSLEGKMVSHYHILEKVGVGGMGIVYKAEDTKLGRFVALKFLSSAHLGWSPGSTPVIGSPRSSRSLERFELEARASSALDHPNICIVHEVGDYQGSPYIVMQFLSGRTLKQEIAGKPLTVERIVELGIQLSDALAAAHAAGIVHLDIKSENVFVTGRGETKILDFGLAKFVSSSDGRLADSLWQRDPDSHLRFSTAFGSIPYMSPEQVLGREIDSRSDLFSLGVVLYEMSTGTLPFRGQTPAAVFESILHQKAATLTSQNPDAPKELERIVDEAIQKDREHRYQTAGDLRQDLERLKSRSTHARGTRTTEIIVVLAIIIATLASYFAFRKRTLPGGAVQSTVVLSDFANTTGESILDQTLKQALRVQLEQSPFLEVIPEEKARQELGYMGRPRETPLINDVAKEVCVRSGGNALIEGSISTLGKHYVIGLHAVNCQTGDSFGEEQAEAASRETILSGLGKAASRLRNHLGETLASVGKYDTPIEEATTSSLDALQAYTLAMNALDREDGSPIPFLKRATELDPNFAMAYARLGNEYLNFNEPRLGIAATTRAYELRMRVSQPERLYIEAHYYDSVTGQADKAAETYQLWQRIYPHDHIPYVNLMSLYTELGETGKAIVEGQQAMRLNPDDSTVYVNLSLDYMNLNRIDRANAVLNEAATRKLSDVLFLLPRYQLAFLQNDQIAMDKQVASSIGTPEMEGWLLAFQADTEAYHGRLTRGRAFSQRAIESAQRDGDRETALMYAAVAALHEAELGNQKVAIDAIEDLPLHDCGQQVLVLGALALARAGATREALALARNLNQQFPENTLLNEYWLPTIRAAVELSSNNPSRAIEILEPTRRYELASPHFPNYVSLYASYLRGSAYLMLSSAEQATTEFQKILEHPGLTGNNLLGALAQLSLARAYAMEAGIPILPQIPRKPGQPLGSRDMIEKSRLAYERFFSSWQDSDPSLQLMTSARKEYQRLEEELH